MTMFQERQRPQRPVQPGDDNTPGGGLDQTRASMDALYRAGRDAINQVLTRDSEAFLRASRQHGGE
jgi:hypothetical protein